MDDRRYPDAATGQQTLDSSPYYTPLMPNQAQGLPPQRQMPQGMYQAQQSMPLQGAYQGQVQQSMPLQGAYQAQPGMLQQGMSPEGLYQGQVQQSMPLQGVYQAQPGMLRQGMSPEGLYQGQVQQSMPLQGAYQGQAQQCMPLQGACQGQVQQSMPLQGVYQGQAQRGLPDGAHGYRPPHDGTAPWEQRPAMGTKRRSPGFWILLATGGLLLLVFLVLLGSAFFKLVLVEERPVSGYGERIEKEDTGSDFWEEEEKEKKNREKSEKDSAEEYEWDSEGVYGATPDADYYAGLTNSINTTTDYQVEWEEYAFEDQDKAAAVYVAYPQLVGENIPNLERLNESLKNFSMSVMDFYNGFYLENWQEGDGLSARAQVYVTYNDDSAVSIVVSEEIITTEAYHNYLCCLNVDLVNGIIDWNTQMLNIDDAFLKEFRKQIATQNGWNMEFTNQELYEYLNDEDMLILYYTPVGLEVGINYLNEYNEVSWVTATIKDYHKYSKLIG